MDGCTPLPLPLPLPHDTRPYPWLVFCHEQSQTFCSLTENTSSVHSIPELSDKIILNSCHGWLILSTIEGERLSVWNPVTYESINLPPLLQKTTSRFEICVLSSPPSHPDSMVFVFHRDIMNFWFCRLHGKRWFEHSYRKNKATSHNTSTFLCSPVSCDNKVYAMTMDSLLENVLVQFDTNKRNKVMLKVLGKLPLPHRVNSWEYRQDLVESCGDLFLLHTDFRARLDRLQVIDMEIHKLDLGSMDWERVTSIQNRAFFLNHLDHRCGSLSVICSEVLGNRVHVFSRRDCVMYSYHVEDRSLSTSLLCSDPETLWGSPKWMMPDRSKEILGEALKNIGKEASKSSEREKERRERVDKETNGTKLVELPLDILKSILDRAPTIDYLNLRRASALCRQVAPALQFETAISRSENLSNSHSPWLVSLHKDGRLCTLSHPLSSDRYNVHVPEELQDAMLWHCKDGWLLVSKSRGDVHILSFFNPFTKCVERYKEVVEEPDTSLQIAFSAPPTSPNCVVVAIGVCYSGTVLISICRSKEEDWLEFRHTHDDLQFDLSYDNPVFSNRVFYFLGRRANVAMVTLQEEGCDWQVIDGPREIDPLFNDSFLAERDGQVFLVLAYELEKMCGFFR